MSNLLSDFGKENYIKENYKDEIETIYFMNTHI